MASRRRAYAGNAAGSFFVDDTCIDCDTCRQLAPLTFHEVDGHSEVMAQPMDADATRQAAQALLSCPTASIGSDRTVDVAHEAKSFPLPITPTVFYCGFNAESSFGAHSYLLRRPEGNWLIDSPRWVPRLAQAIAALGPVAGIFLTHRDDVADSEAYARHFQVRRVIHAADADAAPTAETIQGEDAVELAPGLTALPVPGHTAGSMVLLSDEESCFSGDHVWYSRPLKRLNASRSVCWHSWSQQQRSMQLLSQQRFRWLFPGHGQRWVETSVDKMQENLAWLSKFMLLSA
jgi:glyoxylase-like metal-dependent hydrolase (beta-lactamase superfamily II)/ferredoxin